MGNNYSSSPYYAGSNTLDDKKDLLGIEDPWDSAHQNEDDENEGMIGMGDIRKAKDDDYHSRKWDRAGDKYDTKKKRDRFPLEKQGWGQPADRESKPHTHMEAKHDNQEASDQIMNMLTKNADRRKEEKAATSTAPNLWNAVMGNDAPSDSPRANWSTGSHRQQQQAQLQHMQQINQMRQQQMYTPEWLNLLQRQRQVGQVGTTGTTNPIMSFNNAYAGHTSAAQSQQRNHAFFNAYKQAQVQAAHQAAAVVQAQQRLIAHGGSPDEALHQQQQQIALFQVNQQLAAYHQQAAVFAAMQQQQQMNYSQMNVNAQMSGDAPPPDEADDNRGNA
jgi:hypothetical protein